MSVHRQTEQFNRVTSFIRTNLEETWKTVVTVTRAEAHRAENLPARWIRISAHHDVQLTAEST